jgi:hypothetical protein
LSQSGLTPPASAVGLARTLGHISSPERAARYASRMRHLLLVSLSLVLCSCASKDVSTATNTVAIPLNDLNLVNAAIPEILAVAQKAPYAAPADASCPSLSAQVRALDEVLGPDLDTPPSEANPGLVERGSAAVGEAATSALRRTAEGVVPFRGWVRKLSCAERYSKQVAAAIAAGTVRRAFLKGLAVAKSCA